MRTTTGTKNKIKQFEGLRLKAYVCAAGVCTIGYGHTTGVKPGDVITEARADAFFESDIRAVENQVNALPLHLGPVSYTHLDVYKRQVLESITSISHIKLEDLKGGAK